MSNVPDLFNLRLKSPRNTFFECINLKSICNKLENLCEIVGNNVNVLSIEETELDA